MILMMFYGFNSYWTWKVQNYFRFYQRKNLRCDTLLDSRFRNFSSHTSNLITPPFQLVSSFCFSNDFLKATILWAVFFWRKRLLFLSNIMIAYFQESIPWSPRWESPRWSFCQCINFTRLHIYFEEDVLSPTNLGKDIHLNESIICKETFLWKLKACLFEWMLSTGSLSSQWFVLITFICV